MHPRFAIRTAKHRPALVVQADNIATGLSQVIVAMITSNLSRANHPSRVAVDIRTSQGKTSGLKLDSIIMIDNLSTVLNSAVDRKIGTLTKMAAVESALSYTLNCCMTRRKQLLGLVMNCR